jgi:hypothetical protein
MSFLDGLFARDFFVSGVLQRLLPINFKSGFSAAVVADRIELTAQSEGLIYSDNTVRTLTSASKAQVGADLLALDAGRYLDGTSRLRVCAYGDLPNATASMGVDAYNSGPGVKVIDYSAFVGTPSAGGFEYQCIIAPLTSATQNALARASSTANSTRLQRTASTADMTLAQTLRLMAQSASGTITVNRIEVWSIG